MTPGFDDRLDEPVILVDRDDQPTGTASKWDAHKKGLLHRAFSLLVFNRNGEILLQQRADRKYHSAGLWTNTCCSHPRVDEDIEQAIHRRLYEEMGFDCDITFIDKLHYTSPALENGLVENELLYLYTGVTDHEDFHPERDEVSAWRWAAPSDLKAEIAAGPQHFSYWLQVYAGRFDLDALARNPL